MTNPNKESMEMTAEGMGTLMKQKWDGTTGYREQQGQKMPFSEDDAVDHQVSLYAATKKANELMAHTYSHLFNLPTTGLRFFTVYGPWGRPDMAPIKFSKAILADEAIKVFNYGNHRRDFTYIDDIVDGILKAASCPPGKSDGNKSNTPAQSTAPYQVFNIGNSKPVKLMDFIKAIENASGKEAEKIFMDMQPGDVPITYADVSLLSEKTGYKPVTDLQNGIDTVVSWYREYYKL